MRCSELDGLLEAYLDERLEGAPRDDLRRHLRACADCRQRALEVEPSLLLMLGDPRPADPRRVAACVETVGALVRQARLERSLRFRRRRWLAAAAAITIALGGGLLWRLAPPAGPPGGSPVATRAEVPPPRVEVEMEGNEVRVYHFATDDDPDTAVAFIVNPELEL